MAAVDGFWDSVWAMLCACTLCKSILAIICCCGSGLDRRTTTQTLGAMRHGPFHGCKSCNSRRAVGVCVRCLCDAGGVDVSQCVGVGQ